MKMQTFIFVLKFSRELTYCFPPLNKILVSNIPWLVQFSTHDWRCQISFSDLHGGMRGILQPLTGRRGGRGRRYVVETHSLAHSLSVHEPSFLRLGHLSVKLLLR